MDKLIDELKKPEYLSLSDQEAADALNAKTVVVRRLVPCASIIQHATTHRYRSKLELAQRNPSHQCQGVAIDILSYIDSPKTENVDMDLPETRQMLGALVACEFTTQDVVNDLAELADQTVKWVEASGVGRQSAGTVRTARDEISGLTARKASLMKSASDRWNLFCKKVDSLQLDDQDPVL